MSTLTPEIISSSSDDELFALLGKELESRVSAERGSPEFVNEIRSLPAGLRAMAATFELDVSLTFDDLGWHFGNWHDQALAEETARGLEILGATELAEIFRKALDVALQYWSDLGRVNWSEWYPGSSLESAVAPLNEQAWKLLNEHKNGIFHYWVNYARDNPEDVGAVNT